MSDKAVGTWGRWSPASDRGALNLIGPDCLQRALDCISDNCAFSLAMPLDSSTWTADHRPAPQRFMTRDGGDYATGGTRPDGFQFAEDTWLLPAHSGTHIDALCHAWYDDLLYDGVPASTIRSTTGARRFGAETLGPIVTRGLLIDIPSATDGRGGDGEISLETVREFLDQRGLELHAGDAVLFHTGWLEQARSAEEYFCREPGIGTAAAQWLAESGASLVGADNFALEVHPRHDGGLFPVHRLLLRDYGIPIMENVFLEELAASGRADFLLVVLPLPLVGGTASPVAPLAVT